MKALLQRARATRASWSLAALLGVQACTPSTASPASPPTTPPTSPGDRAANPTMPPPPPTEVEPVVDHYHGVAVTDGYRWLENPEDPRVAAWTAAQNAHARRVLDTMPRREAIAARVGDVLRAPHTRYPGLRVGGGRFFVGVDAPPKQQSFLVALATLDDPGSATTVLDPNVMDPSGKTSIDFYEPSPDGAYVAVSLSKAGTESGDVHVVEVATGDVREVVPRVNGGTAGGDVAWTPDSAGFYYTRYPAPGERPPEDLGFYQQLYHHRLGDPLEHDHLELGDGLPRIAQVRAEVAPDGRVIASVALGDGGQYAHYLRTPKGKFRQLAGFDDGIVEVTFAPDGGLLAITRKNAPRGIAIHVAAKALALERPFERARVLHAPERDTLVSSFWGGGSLAKLSDRFFAIFQLGGPSTARAFDYAGKPLPFELGRDAAAVYGLTRVDDDTVLFRSESFTEPPAWYRVDVRAGSIARTALAETGPIDLHDVRVVRELATSADGTQVPLTVLLPPGAELDGKSPCVATGYGGYGISLTPGYSRMAGLYLERGVIYVVANLRGGGEFGEAWHRAGNLENKQNVFDDFTAVLRHLIARGYTRPERLGIVGGSNGGLLMGAIATQHPDLVRAIVSYVGIYDMLRVELSPNGAFNVTEFGTVKNAAQFEALHAYSPYHHVTDGTPYPAMLMLTGENDPRVDPMHSRKMTARLQAATSGTAPILLRTHADAGHGGGNDLDETIAQITDGLAFMLAGLGVTDGDG